MSIFQLAQGGIATDVHCIPVLRSTPPKHVFSSRLILLRLVHEGGWQFMTPAMHPTSATLENLN
jgi:hypothetical protein